VGSLTTLANHFLNPPGDSAKQQKDKGDRGAIEGVPFRETAGEPDHILLDQSDTQKNLRCPEEQGRKHH